MDAGSIFLILALALIIALFLARPFFMPVPNEQGGTGQLSEGAEHRRSALLAERDRLLTAIQELDFDHRLGKIPAEDYPSMRAGLMQSAALVLRRLDEFETAEIGSAEDRIERAIAERRADVRRSSANAGQVAAPAVEVATAPVETDELEIMIAARKRERQEKSSGFCPKCGRAVKKSDRFCSRCGATI